MKTNFKHMKLILLSKNANKVAMISLSFALSQTPLSGHKLMHYMVCLFMAHTHVHTLVYSQKDGQAELTWVADYIPRWFTHLPYKGQRRLTSLTKTNMLNIAINHCYVYIVVNYRVYQQTTVNSCNKTSQLHSLNKKFLHESKTNSKKVSINIYAKMHNMAKYQKAT